MRKHYLWFFKLLFAACILLGGSAVLKAQQSSSSAVKGGRWSDAATWADNKVPAEGAPVTINQGMDVVLDVSTPPLHGLTINGKLSFANNKDLSSTANAGSTSIQVLNAAGWRVGDEIVLASTYFKDKDSLWVKVVSNGNGARGPIGGGPGGGTSLQVSR